MSHFERFPKSKHPELGPSDDPTGIRTLREHLQKEIGDVFLFAFGNETQPILWNIPVPAVAHVRNDILRRLNCTMTFKELSAMHDHALSEHVTVSEHIRSLPKPWKIFGWTIPGTNTQNEHYVLQRRRDVIVMLVSILDQAMRVEERQNDEAQTTDSYE